MTSPPPPATSLSGPRIGICRGISYGLLDDPECFMPAVRSLGVDLARINLFWSQIEPEPGRFTWDVVDAVLDQLEDGDEAWVTVCSSSPWATQQATRFLPSSPATDIDDYRRFVTELVRRCGGAIRYWQCENEPCVPLLWEGKVDEYLSQLIVFSDVVRESAPGSLVVLGGAVPAAMFAEEARGNQRWAEDLDRIIGEGRDHFDLFDLHPYGDPYAIPALIQASRALLAAHGAHKAIVVGEHNGPMPPSFPENLPYLTDVLTEHRRVFLGQSRLADGGLDFDRTTPAMVDLYACRDQLPPTLQMFMADCSADLAAERDRHLQEEIVIRTMLLLASGVERVACFQLAPEARDTGSRLNIRSLMFDAFALMDYEGGDIGRRRPQADTYALMAAHLADAHAVLHHNPGRPGAYLFEIQRRGRSSTFVGWSRVNETAHITCPWPFRGRPYGINALGENVPIRLHRGVMRMPISSTPLLVGEEGEDR
ncbi:hypothetical protein [Actinomadura sp. NPDC048394]|uniref:hypothetical protein n=1 Tax=Actinomadura sp. NPDC048394 TaxID=3158223 RepID=UPI0033D5C903